MSTTRIAVASDLTESSDPVIMLAGGTAAAASETALDVLHVVKSSDKSDAIEGLRKKLEEQCARLSNENRIDAKAHIVVGEIFTAIGKFVNDGGHELLIIPTHGVVGIKQKLFGANILKVLRSVPTPALVVPDKMSNLAAGPIVFPVGGHENFAAQINAAKLLAKIMKKKVVIYQINRPGMVVTEQLAQNISAAQTAFSEHNIEFSSKEEEVRSASFGFAAQTVDYAVRVNAACICMMTSESAEYSFFATPDKEQLLTNDARIPVLCAGDLA